MPRTPSVRRPSTPGEILLHDFLEPMGLSQAEVARAIKVPYQRLNEVVRGVRRLTPETALRLARYFQTSSELWLNLQLAVDLYDAYVSEAEALEEIAPVHA